MTARHRNQLAGLLVVLFVFAAGQAAPPGRSVESKHRKGPDGLEGWKILSPIPDDPTPQYAFKLVIARNGKVIRTISGEPLIWDWMFLEGGKQVAYESGPLHFGMSCNLADIETGKVVATYDCYHELPDKTPDWVSKLQESREPD